MAKVLFHELPRHSNRFEGPDETCDANYGESTTEAHIALFWKVYFMEYAMTGPNSHGHHTHPDLGKADLGGGLRFSTTHVPGINFGI